VSLDLEPIKAREQVATPGPWELVGSTEILAHSDTPEAIVLADTNFWARPATPQQRADAAFIAAARTDVPALIAEVEYLRESRRAVVAERLRAINANGELAALWAEQEEQIQRLTAALTEIRHRAAIRSDPWSRLVGDLATTAIGPTPPP
jgi:hypothetical protein